MAPGPPRELTIPLELYWLSESAWVLGFLSGVGYEGAGDVTPSGGWTPRALKLGSTTTAGPTRSKRLVDAAGTFVIEHPNEAEARPDRSR